MPPSLAFAPAELHRALHIGLYALVLVLGVGSFCGHNVGAELRRPLCKSCVFIDHVQGTKMRESVRFRSSHLGGKCGPKSEAV